MRIRDAVKNVLDTTTIEDLANHTEEDEIRLHICFIFKVNVIKVNYFNRR